MVTHFYHIFMLHNRYQYAGGEDTSTHAEIAMLKQANHQVTYLEEQNDSIKNFSKSEKIELFFSTTWNQKQYQKIKTLLQEIKPDIVHIQNFFPLLSPSIPAAAKSLNIPTIQHLRNFRLGCLNGYLYRDNQICTDCINTNPWRGVIHRCYRNSFGASLAVWNMITFNRFRKTWLTDVDAFITPSQFAAQKLIQIGIPESRLYVKPNLTSDPLLDQPIPELPDIPTFVFIGRLSPEKGVMILLEAWKKLNQPEWQLIIVGEGPQRHILENFTKEYQLKNIVFYGYQSSDQVINTIKKSTAILVPSQWHEIFGRVVIEAYSCGRCVIASKFGALPEIVEESKTGFIITTNDISDWMEKIKWCANNSLQLKNIGKHSRQIYLEKYSPTTNYQQLNEIYDKVIN